MFGTASAYSSYGGPADDDDLASNPFADLASSSTAALPYQSAASQSAYSSEQDPYPSALPQSPTPASPPSSVLHSVQDEPAYTAPPVPIVEPEQSHQQFSHEPHTPASPPSSHTRSYSREAAPPPETPTAPTAVTSTPVPPGDPDAFTYNPYNTSPPFASRFEAPPTSPIGASPFASESAPATRSKPDLSALLGDERPHVPSFKRTERSPRSEGKAGALGSKIAVLPASSVGRKPVAKPLASLLGLEVEDEPVRSSEKGSTRAGSEASATRDAQDAKLAAPSSSMTTGPSPRTDAPVAEPKANADPISTPLPPSRSETPDLSADDAAGPGAADAGAKPPMERAVSDAPSHTSVDTVGQSVPYEDLVSPLETGDTPKGDDGHSLEWPNNKTTSPKLEDTLSQLHISSSSPTTSADAVNPFASTGAEPPASSKSGSESYSQYIFSDDNNNSAQLPTLPGPQTPVSDGMSRHNLRAPNGSGDEGGFGVASDADSLRGTYSRSVEVAGEAEEVTADKAYPGTPGTDSTAGPGTEQLRRGAGEVSLLPPLFDRGLMRKY